MKVFKVLGFETTVQVGFLDGEVLIEKTTQ